MKLLLFCFFLLVTSSFCQEEFDLSDALAPADTPTERPKTTKKTGTAGELDLNDAFGPDDPSPKTSKPPSSGGSDGFDLSDALKPDATPVKPTEKPRSGGGGGGTLDDNDLLNVLDGDYNPDKGGRASDSGYDSTGGGGNQPQGGGGDQSQGDAGSGPIAGIISAIGVALMGAASSYFAYQKKKLCFKLQGGADPESGKGSQGNQNEPQLFSNLLQSSN